jgi:drug/metabolite transporter (DMT)-like permease
MILIGELFALLTSVCWSISAFAFNHAIDRVNSIQVNTDRIIFAIVLLFVTISLLDISFDVSSSQLIFLFFSGAVGLVFGDSFLFKSYQHIGARISMLLMALSPVMSAVLAYFFLHETLTSWGFVGMIVTISGVALVVLERRETPSSKYKISRIGIFYGLMGALGQAGGLVLAKCAFNEGTINGFLATFIRLVSAVIILFPLVLLARRYKNPIKIYMNDPRALGANIAGTILGPYLGITFSLLAIAKAKVGIASTLMSLMPILMLPIAKYVFKENINWRAIGGAILAVAGVAILFMK